MLRAKSVFVLFCTHPFMILLLCEIVAVGGTVPLETEAGLGSLCMHEALSCCISTAGMVICL